MEKCSGYYSFDRNPLGVGVSGYFMLWGRFATLVCVCMSP